MCTCMQLSIAESHVSFDVQQVSPSRIAKSPDLALDIGLVLAHWSAYTSLLNLKHE